MITLEQLKKIMPRMARNPNTAAKLLPNLNTAMSQANINTKLRMAAFLAQVAHESGEFKYMEEIWGPTPAQLRYEPTTKLSTQLGNIQKGDGFKYKGRGPIQLTGRSNYKACGTALNLDLENHPELAATDEHIFQVACWFWTKNNLNTKADALKGDYTLDCGKLAITPAGKASVVDPKAFDKITKTINGGYNGKLERDTYYKTALTTLT